MKKIILNGFVILTSLFVTTNTFAQAYTESFDDITSLAGNGWVIQNNSTPSGSLSWFQGSSTSATPTPGPFNSHNGAANAYIAANYNSTGSIGTISNWLITPNRTLRNGDVFSFYTRKPTIGNGLTDYPDRLEVRMSANGASTSVGTGASATGDFSTLLLSVNPTLVTNVYPQVWTQYTITISGLPAPTSGRIAFRYFVTSAGSIGTNGDYIGIDQVEYTPYVCPTFTLTNGGALTGGSAGTSYSTTLTQTGALGSPNFQVTSGALPSGLTLSTSGIISGTPTATGTFNFTATVTDNSGCSGSQAYSITSVCPTITMTAGGALTEANAGSTYSSSLTQTGALGSPNYQVTSGALPTGLTLSTSGTISGTPTATGTFNFGITVTDSIGCSSQQRYSIETTCSPNPTSLNGLPNLCSNDEPYNLTEGLPADGTYSGTGVTDGVFDPSTGTQTITYNYNDAYGCQYSTNATLTVNTVPVVSLTAIDVLCVDEGVVTLTAGTPSGGTYSGTGVTNTTFDTRTAGIGDHELVYTYSDGTCSESALSSISVENCLSVDKIENGYVNIYPNPASVAIHVVFENTSSSDAKVTLETIDGKLVFQTTARSMSAFKEEIPTAHLPKGAYFIRIQSKENAYLKNIILQ